MNRRALIFGASLLVLAGAGGAYAYRTFFPSYDMPIYSENGIAIDGTDPVAYFTEGKPVQGSPEFSFYWKGANWQFSSAEHLALFQANPEKYAPQYGGYCAWAVAEKGQLFSTQPDNWAVVDGKLYLNFNDDIQARWEKDVPGFIEEGDRRWPKVVEGLSG